MRQLTATRLVVVSVLFWGVCVTYIAASQTQTIWSGVYTEAQAYRGEKIADTSCIGCHGSGLDGGDSGPKLVGETFLANWSSQSVAQLFDWVREAMPSDAPGTLSNPNRFGERRINGYTDNTRQFFAHIANRGPG